jgi:hypothetical protein
MTLDAVRHLLTSPGRTLQVVFAAKEQWRVSSWEMGQLLY